MKTYMIFIFLILLNSKLSAQPEWKLAKEKNGIKIFMKNVENSKFKSVRVQAVMEGSITKLVNILFQVNRMPEWVYKCKTSTLLKTVSPNEFVYYSETSLPWPVSNRDAVFRMMIFPDTLHHIARIIAVSEPKYIGEKENLVRIAYSKATWYVAEVGNKITIDYTFEVNPGGNIPAWLVNMMADKGPYESFEKLMFKLRR